MWLLIAFIVVPVIEIALFILIGDLIGIWQTLAIVIVTAIIGAWLVRTQGALALEQLRASFSTLNDPTEPLAHGAMILFAGALLLTPGFFTDIVGFSLLLPPVRQVFFQFLKRRVKVKTFDMGQQTVRSPQAAKPSDIIDGEYSEVTPHAERNEEVGTPGNSGWTKH